MIRLNTRRAKAAAATAAVLAVTALGAVAAGAIDGDDTIHACANKYWGTLRIVDDPDSCYAKWEEPIAWSKGGEGPQGPPGPQGEPGPAGPPGDSAAAIYRKVTVDVGRVQLFCDDGDTISGGGGASSESLEAEGPGSPLVINMPIEKGPLSAPTGGWMVELEDNRQVAVVEIICVDTAAPFR